MVVDKSENRYCINNHKADVIQLLTLYSNGYLEVYAKIHIVISAMHLIQSAELIMCAIAYVANLKQPTVKYIYTSSYIITILNTELHMRKHHLLKH